MGACHPEEMVGVVILKNVCKGGLRKCIILIAWGHSDMWSKGCAGGVGLQIYANAVAVLGMLQQEPGAGKALLTCGTYIARRLIATTCNKQRNKGIKYII